MANPERRLQILKYIHEYHRKHMYAPDYREIADGVGVSSTSVIARWLDRLEQDGYITRQKKAVRCIALTDKGLEMVAMIGGFET